MTDYRKTSGKLMSVFLASAAAVLCFSPSAALAQPLLQDDLECVLDMTQQGIPLPRIFSPSIDLSGRGFHQDSTWPQTLAAGEAIDAWQKDIGFRGFYRLQFNLWEISQLDKNKALQDQLLANYEAVIKKVSDAGATVILDIYGIPQGKGKVLDKTSTPVDPAAFKQLVKNYVRYFSVEKKYNIWYEVWSAPDLDEFFLGRIPEYLSLYRCVAEAVKELQPESKNIIPVGGPSSSWWFRSPDESTILTPERSLIYELIKYCCHNKLPLDFITWHAYSTDPLVGRELTAYNKDSLSLIREWLSYFNFPKETPLIVDEWNFDSGLSNVIEERHERANVAASYLFSRLKGMYDAELNGQVFFSLEDFQDNREGVVRNVGALWYEPSPNGYKGGPKSLYNAFRMLAGLEKNYLPQKNNDEFSSGVIATKGSSGYVVIAYNYSDPDIFRSYVSRSLALLNEGERRSVLSVMDTNTAAKIASHQINPEDMKLPGRVRALLKKAQDLSTVAGRFKTSDRQFRLNIKNMRETYMCRRYVVDGSCYRDCVFAPIEEKELTPQADASRQEVFTIKPYSVEMYILTPKPPQAPAVEAPAKSEETAPAEGDVAPSQPSQPPAAAAPVQEPQPAKAEAVPPAPVADEAPKTATAQDKPAEVK